MPLLFLFDSPIKRTYDVVLAMAVLRLRVEAEQFAVAEAVVVIGERPVALCVLGEKRELKHEELAHRIRRVAEVIGEYVDPERGCVFWNHVRHRCDNRTQATSVVEHDAERVERQT